MDNVFLVLRVVVALGAVFGALLIAHRWITKGRPGAAPRNRQIAIVARQGLGAKAGIAIVDAAGRRYLLGVTEHAVTVLDTLGEAPPTDGPALVSAQPLAAAAFERELRQVALATGATPVIVHGRPDPRNPGDTTTQTLAIIPDRTAATSLRAASEPAVVGAPASSGPTTRRALREAERRRLAAQGGLLAGSVLSPGTWRQALDAVKRLR